ncbi:MAG: hypothetical protein ACI8Y4_002697 [Candidatus Poriferisodalaceae bacterium]|jgi:hypothetical protein
MVPVCPFGSSDSANALAVAVGFALDRVLPGATPAWDGSGHAIDPAICGGALPWGDELLSKRCFDAACASLEISPGASLTVNEDQGGTWTISAADRVAVEAALPGEWLVAVLVRAEQFHPATEAGRALAAGGDESAVLAWAAAAIDAALAGTKPHTIRRWLAGSGSELRRVRFELDELRHRYDDDLRAVRRDSQ